MNIFYKNTLKALIFLKYKSLIMIMSYNIHIVQLFIIDFMQSVSIKSHYVTYYYIQDIQQ